MSQEKSIKLPKQGTFYSNLLEPKNLSKRKRTDNETLSQPNKLFKSTISLIEHNFYSLLSIFSKNNGKLEDIITELNITRYDLENFINNQLFSTTRIPGKPSALTMMLEIGEKIKFSYKPSKIQSTKPFKECRLGDRKKISEQLTIAYLNRHFNPLDLLDPSELFKGNIYNNSVNSNRENLNHSLQQDIPNDVNTPCHTVPSSTKSNDNDEAIITKINSSNKQTCNTLSKENQNIITNNDYYIISQPPQTFFLNPNQSITNDSNSNPQNTTLLQSELSLIKIVESIKNERNNKKELGMHYKGDLIANALFNLGLKNKHGEPNPSGIKILGINAAYFEKHPEIQRGNNPKNPTLIIKKLTKLDDKSFDFFKDKIIPEFSEFFKPLRLANRQELWDQLQTCNKNLYSYKTSKTFFKVEESFSSNLQGQDNSVNYKK